MEGAWGEGGEGGGGGSSKGLAGAHQRQRVRVRALPLKDSAHRSECGGSPESRSQEAG